MKLDELIVLLPCHGLDDFPTNLSGDDAEGLLAAWSALWHPVLVAATGRLPSWRRAEFPSDTLNGKLVVVPPVVERQFSGDMQTRADNEGGAIVRGLTRRDDIIAVCLAKLKSADENVSVANIDQIPQELIADFLAFGTAYLESELLVRRMRYSSNLDDGRVQTHLVAAAMAAVSGDPDGARQNLTLCANVLVESRGRYYPVDMSLLDLTLVASTTIGPALRRELAGSQAINLLIAGSVVAQMADREPETVSALRSAITANTVCLAGGEWTEIELPLVPLEIILKQLRRGLATYKEHLGARPTIYGRRRFGLTSALPRILLNLGFRGAIHFTLDDGKFPQSDSTKTRWEGFDSATIDAIGRAPLDARQNGTFVALAEKIGHAMDHDHVATIGLAHWPSQSSIFYDDLRRVAGYAPVLGKFVTLDHYFANTDPAGGYSRNTPDEYRSPYLQQAVSQKEVDPLSRWARYHRKYVEAMTAEHLETLATLLRQRADPSQDSMTAPRSDSLIDPAAEIVSPLPTADWLSQAATRFAAVLPKEKREAGLGYLTLNPVSYGRRVLLDVSQLPELPSVKAPIRAAEEIGGKKRVVVDLPPMGFAWIAATAGEPGRNWSGSPIANNLILRNEFCEVTIHGKTGGIQSVHDFRSRGNRLSQQLVWRPPTAPVDSVADDAEATFSRMDAQSVEVTDAGLLRGEITSRGQLVDPTGQRLSGFTQRVQMTLGSRLVVIEIDLDPAESLTADPWNSYIASRFAWSDRTSELRRGVHLQSHLTRARRFEAPHFVQVEGIAGRTALFTGGMPHHSRVGSRMLDTLLSVQGETATKFRLGIGLDVVHPWMAALDLLSPEIARSATAAPPEPVSYGWLFHLDAKNVLVTHWEPLWHEPNQGKAGGPKNVVGVRCRLMETEGRAVLAQLRCFRAPVSAQQTDFENQPTGALAVKDDRVSLDLGAYEWVQLEARWK